MDGRIGFSASNRSNYILGRRSNCSWGPVITGLKNQRNWSRFNLYLHNHECYGKTDGSIGFSASDRSIYAPERWSNGSWGLFVSGWKKGVIGKIGDVIGDSSITSDRNGKRIPAFDSPRKISLNAAMEQRPTRGWSPCVRRLKKRQIGDIFASALGTSGDTGKWMLPLDSAHQIGLSSFLEDVLIVVWGSSSLDFKKQRNRSRFWLYLHNQGQYGNMDDGVGFSASNRFIYAPERRSNGSWGLFVSEIEDVISDSSIASDCTGKWTPVFWLAASNKLKCGPEWRAYCSLRPYVIGLKKRQNWQIWRDFQWTSGAVGK